MFWISDITSARFGGFSEAVEGMSKPGCSKSSSSPFVDRRAARINVLSRCKRVDRVVESCNEDVECVVCSCCRRDV